MPIPVEVFCASHFKLPSHKLTPMLSASCEKDQAVQGAMSMENPCYYLEEESPSHQLGLSTLAEQYIRKSGSATTDSLIC